MVKTSKASFQVNSFGGAKLVRAKEMCQFGIILVDQGVYFSMASFFGWIVFHLTMSRV